MIDLPTRENLRPGSGRTSTDKGHHAPLRTREPSSQEIAWAAGFFQGEGHVRNDFRNCCISQVEIEPLMILQEIFGGSVVQRKPRNNQSDFWHWSVCGTNLQEFARAIVSWMSGDRKTRLERVIGHH